MHVDLKEKREIKILFTGLYSSLNNGELAMLFSAKRLLRRSLLCTRPLDFLVFPIYPDISPDRYETKVVGFRFNGKLNFAFHATLLIIQCFLFRCIGVTIGKKSGLLNEITSPDVFVDISGDSISDDYGTTSTLMRGYFFILGVILNKPIIVLGQSIGPFKNPLTQMLARYFLNRSKLITLREKITLKYLQELGVDLVPAHLTADLAFLLEPRQSEELENEICFAHKDQSPIVGVCVSQQIHSWSFPNISDQEEKYKEYVKLIANLIDFLCNKKGANVIILPHVYGPKKEHDDRIVAKDIYNFVESKRKVKNVQGIYAPNELKWVIGKFDMLVSCRMHPVIASTSMYVPTISLAYNHKFHGIIGKMLNLDEYVVDVRKYDAQELLSILENKIEAVWKYREEIRKSLKKIMPQILEQARLNGELVSQLINETIGIHYDE